MAKKVNITPKSRMQEPDPVDSFVKDGGKSPSVSAPTGEATKRLTIDISEPLHRRIKAKCAEQGVKMADVIRELLETHFA